LRRTGAVVGTLTRLSTEGSLAVLENSVGLGTGEYLTRESLDFITLDDAARNPG
jgi:hypothetical protein